MAAPLEFRHFLKLTTLKDVANGVQPLRDNGICWNPPVLQWRCKEKVTVEGATSLQWSEWADVPFVREEMNEPDHS